MVSRETKEKGDVRLDNQIIKIQINERQEQVVSARELHAKLGISKRFTDWFKYQAGRLHLVEQKDFITILGESTGGRPNIDYIIPLDIAKHLCMVSGGPMAWKIRDYFIEVEKQWNSPEQVMARALQIANAKMLEYQNKVLELETKVETDKPKVLFADAVTTSKNSVLVGELAKLLRQNGVDIGQNRLFKWLRNNGYLGKSGENYNLPTQYAMDLELFEIKKTVINNPDGSQRVTRTPKVTGKGQVYFINKFLSERGMRA